MNHADFIAQLDDYFDGSLADAERRRMNEHASACDACAAALGEMAALLDEAHRLPRAIEPAFDAWPQVESAIRRRATAERRRRRVIGAGLAATAATVVLGGTLLFYRTYRAPSPVASVGERSSEAFGGLVSGLDLECMGAGQCLQASFRLPATSLSPGAVAVWTPALAEAVAILDRSIAETRTALEQAPGDATLRVQLATRYQQKLALLQLALVQIGKA